MKTLLVTIALAIATPAFADDFNNAIQTYEVDQRLNELARQAIQSNQNTFNNNPIFNHQPGSGCPPLMWAYQCH